MKRLSFCILILLSAFLFACSAPTPGVIEEAYATPIYKTKPISVTVKYELDPVAKVLLGNIKLPESQKFEANLILSGDSVFIRNIESQLVWVSPMSTDYSSFELNPEFTTANLSPDECKIGDGWTVGTNYNIDCYAKVTKIDVVISYVLEDLWEVDGLGNISLKSRSMSLVLGNDTLVFEVYKEPEYTNDYQILKDVLRVRGFGPEALPAEASIKVNNNYIVDLKK